MVVLDRELQEILDLLEKLDCLQLTRNANYQSVITASKGNKPHLLLDAENVKENITSCFVTEQLE